MMEVPDHSTTRAHLDNCCDICGDIGVSDAIITCPRCKISCEHMYCMRTSMKHLRDWYCDDCQRRSELILPTSVTSKDLAKGSPMNTASRLSNPIRTDNQLCDLQQNWIDRKKKVPTGKVKFMDAEEVIMLSSGAKKSGFGVKSTSSSSPISWKKAASALDKTPVKPKFIPAKSSIQKVRANPPIVISRQLKFPQPTKSHMNEVPQHHLTQHFKGLKEKDAIQAPLKEDMQKEQSKDTAEFRVEIQRSETACASSLATCGQASINSGGDAFPNVELQRTHPTTANPVSIIPRVGKCLCVPSSDASWKGSFRIYNDPKYEDMNDGFQAYPPSRVRKKVYEFSKFMPEVLQFELVPCGDIWANLFQNYCLDGEDIGLYFFPSNIKRCENYISLLEVLGAKDLAMRSLMDGVELLIFTSKFLRLDCQKWEGRQFLWGVFHSLRKSKLHVNQVDAYEFKVESVSNEDVDMEVDMVGGEEVGRMDIAVRRESLQVVASTEDIAAANEACNDNDDMDLDMMGGEEVGRRDVAVSKESLKVLPLAMNATDSREARHNDIPPGFENVRPIKVERPHSEISFI